MNKTKGFTLIEVLASIFILSFVIMALVTLTTQTTTTSEEIIREDSDLLKIYTASQVIRKDVSLMYSPVFQSPKLTLNKYRPIPNEQPENEEDLKKINDKKAAFEQLDTELINKYRNNKRFSYVTELYAPIPKIIFTSDSLQFMTQGHMRKNRNEKTSIFEWVKFSVEDPTSEELEQYKASELRNPLPGSLKKFVRYQLPKNPFASDLEDELPKGQVLMDKVESVEWEYYSYDKKEFTTMAQYSESPLPITALKLKISFYNVYNIQIKKEFIFRTLYKNEFLDSLKELYASPNNLENSENPDNPNLLPVPPEMPQ
jgi:prepilin-type N-terminal cleavage/methylation domain-containing protein